MAIILIDILNVINFALQIGEIYQNTTIYIFLSCFIHMQLNIGFLF